MCGIAGLLTTRLQNAQACDTVRRMTDQMVHRGPDDEGIWSDTWNADGGVVLGHRRLSIQDLSELGKQPMRSHSDRYVVAFNGEIYNFREVAERLAQHGHSFNGHSDTEVLLTAVEQWGLGKALEQFTGMFAFALWDREEKQLYLCRDRMGEKPLYYGIIDDTLYFASELSAIEAALPGRSLPIDLDGLATFLQFGYISAPRSIYRGINKLPPGCLIVISQQSIPRRQALTPASYWRLRDVAESGLARPITDQREATERLESALHDNIRRQLIADVRVGTFLSGGIDSTLVTAIAQQESAEKVRTYTIGFTEKEYDESAYAGKIAGHLGTEHTTLTVSPQDVLGVVPQLQDIYDEPFADSSQIPTYLVSHLAREHVTVCLSGDGGDELFAGYNRYIWTQSLWSKLSRLPSPLRHLAGSMLSLPSPSSWDRLYGVLSRNTDSYQRQKLVGLKLQKLAGLMQQDDIHQAYQYLMSYWYQPSQLLNASLRNELSAQERLQPVSSSFIDQAMYLDQSHYLPGDNLTKTDRASMAVSLETRLPLLSHEIVELSWRIPLEFKVRDRVSKHILRDILYKSVPREMIDRPKMGFSVPVASWLRNELRGWAGDLIMSSPAAEIYLDTQLLRKTWQQHQAGSHDHSSRLWTVLMFLSWMQHRH